jgi:hypothetical protein
MAASALGTYGRVFLLFLDTDGTAKVRFLQILNRLVKYEYPIFLNAYMYIYM